MADKGTARSHIAITAADADIPICDAFYVGTGGAPTASGGATLSGVTTVNGSANSINFASRDTGATWSAYNSGGSVRLWQRGDKFTFNSDSLNLTTGVSLKVNNVKVIGAQGATVADAAALTSVEGTNAVAARTQAEFNALATEFNKLRTDLGATVTKLNTTLARVRAATGHGLIA